MLTAIALIGADILALMQPKTTRAYLLDVVAETGILLGWWATRWRGRAHSPDTQSERDGRNLG